MEMSGRDSWNELSLKVKSLQSLTTYPHENQKIKSIETHMSWVFVGDEWTYKLKKPVKFDFLNLTHIEDRKKNCEVECQINHKLAPGIYHSVVPLLQFSNSKYQVADDEHVHPSNAHIADWLIKMKTLPAEKTLQYQLIHNEFNEMDLLKGMNSLVEFYRTQPVEIVEIDDYKNKYENCLKESLKILSRKKYHLSGDLIKMIHEELLNFIFSQGHLLDERVRKQKIKECHGDLRPEHIYFVDQPIFIDRLDFNQDFRIMDPLEEVSYLAMECQFLHHPDAAEFILEHYKSMAPDDHFEKNLSSFYQSYRAILRAKMCALHFEDKKVINKDYFLEKASEYIQLSWSILEKSSSYGRPPAPLKPQPTFFQ